MKKEVLSLAGRLAVTGVALGWVLRLVEIEKLRAILQGADRLWLLGCAALYFLATLGGVLRWQLLVPRHPALTFGFLTRSYLVGSFFSLFLPTTVGGDVVRGYDLIKATGEWKGSLASLLADRLIGMLGFLFFALAAWAVFPVAREDPVVRWGFLGFCGVAALAFAVLGSRRILHSMLKPFGKIGLGTLQSHAKQFQESLLSYFKHPVVLLKAFGWSVGVVQLGVIGVYFFAAKALALPIPFLYLLLIVPVIATLSQIPISVSGWGIREAVTIALLGPIGIGQSEALAVSLIYASCPLLTGAVGGIIFLTRRKRKRPADSSSS